MKTKIVSSIVILLVVVGFFLWKDDEPDRPAARVDSNGAIERTSGDPVAADPPLESSASPEASEPSVEPTMDAEDTEDATSSSATVIVRVTHVRTSEPVRAVPVTVSIAVRGGFESPPTVETDEAGVATFEVAGGAHLWSVRAGVGPETTAVAEYPRQTLVPGSRTRLSLVVGSGGTLRGRVVDDDDRPVPGAVVEGWEFGRFDDSPDHITTADGQGEFELDRLGSSFVLSAHADGLACLRGLRGRVAEGATVEGLTIHLTKAFTLRGVVLDPDRRPVADADVAIETGLQSGSSDDATAVDGVTYYRGGRGRATTDEHGRFEIPALPWKFATLEVKREPFVVHRDSHTPTLDEIEIVLDRGSRLFGTVHDAGGRPAAGAHVAWGPFYRDKHPGRGRMKADATGRFEFMGVTEGDVPLWVGVRHAGHAIVVQQPALLDTPITLQLERAQPIAGIVVNESGEPVFGAAVEIAGDRRIESNHLQPSTWESLVGSTELTTDEDGRFLFDSLYSGRFELRVTSPRHPDLSVMREVDSGGPELRIVLDPVAMRKVVFRGTVRSEVTGAPIPQFSVMPIIGGMGRGRGFTDPKGRFELVGLEPGRITLQVSADGHSAFTVPAETYDVGEHEFDIVLRESRTLRLFVHDEDGEPVSAALTVFDELGQPVTIWSGSMGSTRADLREGRAALHRLPAERVTVVIHRTGGGSGSMRREIDLSQAIPEEVAIRFESERTVALGFFVGAPIERVESLTFTSRPELIRTLMQPDLARVDRPTRLALRGVRTGTEWSASVTPTEAGAFEIVVVRSGPGTLMSQELPIPIVGADLPLDDYELTVIQGEQVVFTATLTRGDLDAGDREALLLLGPR